MGAQNLDGCVQEAAGFSPDPAEESAKNEYWSIVEAALSPKQFQAVQMYFRESLTQEDIAERLGISQPRSAQLLSESLARLKKRVGRKLEAAIPAARKPPIRGHLALHAYQMAMTEDEHQALCEDHGADTDEDRRDFGRWTQVQDAPFDSQDMGHAA